MIEKIKRFFEEARTELGHVNWPTRPEALKLSGIVIVISLGIAFLMGAFDYGFAAGINYLITNFYGG